MFCVTDIENDTIFIIYEDILISKFESTWKISQNIGNVIQKDVQLIDVYEDIVFVYNIIIIYGYQIFVYTYNFFNI